MYQVCIFEEKLWLINSVDRESHKFLLILLGGEKTVLVEPSLVKIVDAACLTSRIEDLAAEQEDILDATDTENVSQKRKENALERFNAITAEISGELTAKEAAQKCKMSLSQYYEVRHSYNPKIGVRSLFGQARGRKVGTQGISEEVENIIKEQFDLWWCGENPTKRGVWKGVQSACRDFGLPPPAYETVCNRIDNYSNYDLEARSRGEGYASDHFKLRAGTRELTRALEQVQMDHTVADCFLCSMDNPLQVVGRPWITILVCSKTRIILGFYVSFRSPSLGSVACALKHAVTSKEVFMKRLGLQDHEYPYWGVMRELFTDNAREFRSSNLYSACVLQNIKLRHRREKQEGGICERLFGTLNIGTIRVLPGGTAAKPRKDQGYDPAKHALLTLPQFIRELTLGICEYHDTVGGEDQKSPRQRWNELFTGEDGNPVAPMPVHNLRNFIIEILPEESRTVSPSGVINHRIFYNTPLLKDLVGKRVRIKYDDANLSRVLIRIEGEWVEAPARGSPPESLAELHINQKLLLKPGTLGDHGLAARKARTESRQVLRERALRKAHEVTAQEQDSGEAPIPNTPLATPLRGIRAERRDFTRIADAYDGEEEQ